MIILRPLIFSLALAGQISGQDLPEAGLLLDLDAGRGVTLEDTDRVAKWTNQASNEVAREFVKRDEGRKEKGSGRPTLQKENPLIGGKPSLSFRQQELVCMEEDAFDDLTTGKGHTWITVLAVYEQRVGLKDVNSFFGNLRNGKWYEGFWGNVEDDNTLWSGSRNGLSFGRFDENNPKLTGQKLETGKFYILAGRQPAGTGTVTIELFADDAAKPVATAEFPVNPDANPSKMAIGQERDATKHPGKESFDGEIARFLIWERPLTDKELANAFKSLKSHYDL